MQATETHSHSQQNLNIMIVCLCTGASDRDVHDAIDHGARCVCDFKKAGIGTSCGGCHDTLRTMMATRGVAARSLCVEETILARIRPGSNPQPQPVRLTR